MIYTYHNLQEAVPRKQLVKELYNRVIGLHTSSQIQQLLKDFIELGQEVPPMQGKNPQGEGHMYYRWHSDPAIGEHPLPSRSGWYQSESGRGYWKPADSVAHVLLDRQTSYLTSLQRKL